MNVQAVYSTLARVLSERTETEIKVKVKESAEDEKDDRN